MPSEKEIESGYTYQLPPAPEFYPHERLDLYTQPSEKRIRIAA